MIVFLIMILLHIPITYKFGQWVFAKSPSLGNRYDLLFLRIDLFNYILY